MANVSRDGCASPLKMIFPLLAVTAAVMGSAPGETGEVAGFGVEQVESEGVRYEVVRAEASRVRLLWKDGGGKKLRTFTRARDYLESRGERALMITSGGVFAGEGNPMGLHVEDGKERKELNLGDGEGNFYIKPNGVLLIRESEEGRKALIWSSSIYSSWLKVRKDQNELPVFAMQSGPMLVMRGMTNLKLDPGSKSKMDRNGVGIDADGRVVFAITAKGESVNLHGFAKFFESLGCKNALYLNGDIPQMVVNPKGRISSHGFGSIFAVVEPMRESVIAGDGE